MSMTEVPSTGTVDIPEWDQYLQSIIDTFQTDPNDFAAPSYRGRRLRIDMSIAKVANTVPLMRALLEAEFAKQKSAEAATTIINATKNPTASPALKSEVDTTLTTNHNAQAALAAPLRNSPNPLATKPTLKESAADKDNNARQAEAFMESLKSIASTNPTAKTMLDRFTNGKGNDADNYVNLSMMNIGGMLKWMSRSMPMDGYNPVGYTSNGADNGETNQLRRIVNTLGVSTDKAKITELAKQMVSFYDASQTTEDYLASVQKSTDTTPYNKDTFIASLSEYRAWVVSKAEFKDGKSKLESTDRSYFNPYAPGELSTYFKWLSDGDLLSRLNSVLKIGGVSSNGKDLTQIADAMKMDPTIRSAYIKGLNIVAFSNDRSTFFRTGKFESGLNTETSTKLIEKMQNVEIQSAVRDGVNNTATTEKNAVANDTKLTEAQKKSITAKIDRVIAELSTPEKITALSIESAMAMTNRRIGGGVSVGTELNSALADSVSLTGSLSKEFGWKIGSLIALSFTKEIFASESAELGAHYGLSYASKFVPFLGVHGRYEDIVAAITKNPVGVNIYAGLRMGTNRDQDTRLQKEVGKSAEAISKLTRDTKTIDAIDLKWIVTSPDIVESMTKNLKVFLEANKYDPAASDLVKETVMKSSIMEAMNIELLSLYRQKNDMWWVLDQAGVNFGQLAGLAYIIPGFRIARSDLVVEYTKSTATKKVGETINTIDGTTLFSTPVFRAGTKEYSVEFKKSDINKWLIVLPTGASWDTSSDGKNTTISGLKDNGIKVTLQDGKYKVEYDTTKPVSVVEWRKGTDAISTTDVTESLERISSIGEALSSPQVRKALSHLWLNPTRKPQANIFANAIQNIGTSPTATIEQARAEFIQLVTKPNTIKEFVWTVQVLSAMKNARQLSSALYDIRWAMMMDENQARNVSKSTNGSLEVKENMNDTKKRFDAMTSNSRMTPLLSQMGISPADYAGMIAWSGNKITLGAPKPGIMGAIASLKTETAYMARMPAGTVRFAQSGTREFAKDISATASPDQKAKMFDTILSSTSLDALSLRTNIAKTLWLMTKNSKGDALPDLEKVTFANLKDLMVTGTATINGRAIKMEWQKFWLCAYGDCTNPGITMEAGRISTPAIPGNNGVASVEISASEVVVKTETVDNYTTAFGTRHIGVNIGVWYEAKDPQTDVPATTTTNYRTEIQTQDVQVWPNNIQTINWNRVIVVNTGGTQTNIPLNSLTRVQAIALTQGQSITLPVSVSVTTPYQLVTPGYSVVNRNPATDSINGINAFVQSPMTDKDIWNSPQATQWKYDSNKYPTNAAYINFLLSTDFPFKQ